jgi:signal transduction histidine kinase
MTPRNAEIQCQSPILQPAGSKSVKTGTMTERIKRAFLKQEIYNQIDAEDILGRQRFSLFRIFSLTGALVSLGVFMKMYFMFSSLDIIHVVLPVLSSIMLINFYNLSNTKTLDRAYYIVLLSAFTLLHIVSYSTGGIRSASIIYHSVVILYAFMLLGKKGGKIFSVLFGLQVLYIFFISRYTDLTSFAFLDNKQDHIEEDFLFNALFSFFLITAHSNYLNSGRNIVLRKVTEQRDELAEKNNLLNRANATLENANRELDKFAYVVSHDLKAPLRAIGAVSGIIKQDIGAGELETINPQLDIIQQRVKRMENLIDGILAYSKAARAVEEPALVNIYDLIRNTADMLNASENCHLSISSDLSVKTGSIKLQQLFLNLIDNAIKHNDKINPQIEITVNQYEEYLHCTVKDNGPGIEEKFHEKIFVIFQTLKARDEFESTGIGLSIVKRIVDDAGGKIWIHSEKGKGTEFHFTWPFIMELKTVRSEAEYLF